MRLFITVFSLCFSATALSERAYVSRVIDGDTIEAYIDGQKERIRLECIDAPETAQAYGSNSTRLLHSLISDEDVTLNIRGEDRYGRLLAIIYFQGEDINQKMVQAGLAWNYDRYCDSYYQDDEDIARTNRRGLWAAPNPIAPWDWRRQN